MNFKTKKSEKSIENNANKNQKSEKVNLIKFDFFGDNIMTNVTNYHLIIKSNKITIYNFKLHRENINLNKNSFLKFYNDIKARDKKKSNKMDRFPNQNASSLNTLPINFNKNLDNCISISSSYINSKNCDDYTAKVNYSFILRAQHT